MTKGRLKNNFQTAFCKQRKIYSKAGRQIYASECSSAVPQR